MEQQMYKVQIDGEERSFPAGTTYLQIAGEYQERYPHDIVLVYVNGKLQELGKKLKKDCALHFVTTGETINSKIFFFQNNTVRFICSLSKHTSRQMFDICLLRMFN